MTDESDTRYSITERWLRGAHGRTRYWQSSPQHGVPVVFIHGYGALIEHWSRVLRPVVRTHTAYALDLYGFGYSAHPIRPSVRFTKELWTDQVADLISTVVPGPVVVVGHSIGGMVAAQLAADYPEFVRGLVLVDSVGLFDSGNTLAYTIFDRMFFGVLRMPGVGEALSLMLTNPRGVRQFMQAMYYRWECITPQQVATFSAPLRRVGAPRSYLAVMRAMSGFFLDIQPGDVTVPTLIIWGAQDRTLPPSLAHAFKHQMFPQAQIQVIPESGHCPFDETPEAFCDALLPWIDAAVGTSFQ